MQSDEKGALAEYLEKRTRKVRVVDVGGFFDIDGTEIGRIAFRPPTTLEQHNALAQAHLYVKEKSTDNPGLAADPDFTEQAKLAFIMHVCCRRPEKMPDGSERYVFPTFPHPRWMLEHIEPERISVLVRIANSVRVELGPEKPEFSDAAFESVIAAASATAGTETLHALFATMPREYLEHLVCRLSLLVEKLRAEGDTGPVDY